MRTLGLLMALSFLVSCSLEAKLTLLPSGAMGVEATIAVKTQTKDAWRGLRDLDPSLPVDPFDPGLWRQGLGMRARIITTDTGTSVAFPIPDPRRFFIGLKTDSGSWDLTLDRATLRRLASLTTWSGSPVLDSLIPAPGAAVTEADYRDLLVYLLGPGTSTVAAGALVDASTVQLTIVAPRPVLSAEGSVSIDGNQAVYRWPLVRVLTLETPLHLRLTF